MVALGFAAGLWTASRRCLRNGILPEQILDLGPWLVVGAILGARALYVATFWKEQFSGRPLVEVFRVWEGGLVYYGGLLGAALGCIFYCGARKLPLWKMADTLAPSIALGQAFGRMGCLMNGCCYGRACHLPWAIQFPEGNAAGAPTLPVHPTQIYESLLCLVLYAFLEWLYRRKKQDATVFATYLVGYALLRSFVELFRGDYPPNQLSLGGWFTPGHWASSLILLTGVLLFASRRWAHSEPPPAAP